MTLRSTRDVEAGEGAWDDLVQMLAGLSHDVERFHDMVDVQRRALEEFGTDPGAASDDELARQARLLGAEAQKVAASARKALDEMRRLSPPRR